MSVDPLQQARNLYQEAFTSHQQGRLEDARTGYQRVLRLQPNNAGALSMLGVIALQANDPKAAISLLEAAIASDASNVMAHLYQGMAYSMINQHQSAVQCYDRAIAIDPESNALPHYNRANALMQLNHHEDAVEGYDRAIAIESDLDAEAYFERGIALQRLKRPEVALASFERAIELESPRTGEAHFHRGVTLKALGQHAGAVESFDRALVHRPDLVDAHRARIGSLQELGRFEEALAGLDALTTTTPASAEVLCARGIFQIKLSRFDAALESLTSALAIKPDLAPALNGRGLALASLGRFEAALSDYEHAIICDPAHAEAHFNAGNAHVAMGDLTAARSSFEAAVKCNRQYAEAFYNLGKVHQELSDPDAAFDAYEAAIGANSSLVDAHINKGMLLKDCGDVSAAINSFRQLLEIDRHNVAAHSNLAFSLMFIADDHQPMLSACQLFNERIASRLKRNVAASLLHNDGSRQGRLRIGYVSPDFKDHCQSFFTLPLIENHDHSAFEIFCYSSVSQPDALTRRIGGRADTFRDVRGLDDAALAALISRDRIDILVDLTMHMADGRPLLFAQRAAPVQVTWLAYPGTTGIEAIDYRFSDPRLDPPGFDSHYTERTIRLPDAFWCYDPLAEAPAANQLPAFARGHLTFGCLNNTCKLSDRTLRLWAPVLAVFPDARLLLMVPPGKSRARLLQRARAVGIEMAQLQFVARRPRDEYLLCHHDIDLCLDTLPYNGHTTNLDSLWMGVPFVTRVGSTSVGRAGLSLLYQLGLTELAADTDERFASMTIALAKDRQRLASLRRELRSRLQNSPLMDGRRFAAHVEAAYRSIATDRVSNTLQAS